MTLETAFAHALRTVRQKRGLSQEDFGDVSSRTYVSTLERGLKSPTIEKVDALARKMGVHPLTLHLLAYAELDRASVSSLLKEVLAEVAELEAAKVVQERDTRPARGRVGRRRR